MLSICTLNQVVSSADWAEHPLPVTLLSHEFVWNMSDEEGALEAVLEEMADAEDAEGGEPRQYTDEDVAGSADGGNAEDDAARSELEGAASEGGRAGRESVEHSLSGREGGDGAAALVDEDQFTDEEDEAQGAQACCRRAQPAWVGVGDTTHRHRGGKRLPAAQH